MSVAPRDIQLQEMTGSGGAQRAHAHELASPSSAASSAPDAHGGPQNSSSHADGAVGTGAHPTRAMAEPLDDSEHDWGKRSSDNLCSTLVGFFIAADPFQQPLRPRPRGSVVSENAVCTFLLVSLMVVFGVVQALRLRDAPPITVSEVVPTLPVTDESMVMLFMQVQGSIPGFNYSENRDMDHPATEAESFHQLVAANYDCVLTQEAMDVYARMDGFKFPPKYQPVGGYHTEKARCFLEEGADDFFSSNSAGAGSVFAPPGVSPQARGGMRLFPGLNTTGMRTREEMAQTCTCLEVPLVHKRIDSPAHLLLESVRTFDPALLAQSLGDYLLIIVVHDESLDGVARSVSSDPRLSEEEVTRAVNGVVFESDLLRWSFRPGEVVVQQASLEVKIDMREPEGSRVTKRVTWNVIDVVQQNFSKLGYRDDQHVQRMILEMASTYTRFTIQQPEWILPWLSSLGGAFTLLLMVLSLLKAILRPCIHSRATRRLYGRLCTCCHQNSCLHTEVETVVQKQWVTTQAMQKML